MGSRVLLQPRCHILVSWQHNILIQPHSWQFNNFFQPWFVVTLADKILTHLSLLPTWQSFSLCQLRFVVSWAVQQPHSPQFVAYLTTLQPLSTLICALLDKPAASLNLNLLPTWQNFSLCQLRFVVSSAVQQPHSPQFVAYLTKLQPLSTSICGLRQCNSLTQPQFVAYLTTQQLQSTSYYSELWWFVRNLFQYPIMI